MYNRYIHRETDNYMPIPDEEPACPPPPRSAPPGREGLPEFLRSLLDRFHLDSIDSGDLLLLGLLFFLYREGADEELLAALGLLLIL